MATDRQTPCVYYVCAGLCKKGKKADHATVTNISRDVEWDIRTRRKKSWKR